MQDNHKQLVADLLSFFKRKGIQADKVLLHKFLYFLQTQGMLTGFRFEPYTYGPYSFDLARTLRSMDFWDEIEDGKSIVSIKDLSNYSSSPERQEKLDTLFQQFKTITGELSFRNLECTGTVLYCAEVIRSLGDDPTSERVAEEFKAWKGNRYSDQEITGVYERLRPYL